jgi:hypothetical protein
MKRRQKTLRLNRETVRSLNLKQAAGGITLRCGPDTEVSRCVTDCDTCGATNYITCYSCDFSFCHC